MTSKPGSTDDAARQGVGRRRFLQAGGLVLGGAALAPLVNASGGVADAMPFAAVAKWAPSVAGSGAAVVADRRHDGAPADPEIGGDRGCSVPVLTHPPARLQVGSGLQCRHG
jgi:hypothetical protein